MREIELLKPELQEAIGDLDRHRLVHGVDLVERALDTFLHGIDVVPACISDGCFALVVEGAQGQIDRTVDHRLPF
ncbi:hypothetical protein D3C80_1293120 [compost metagenome]